MEYTLQPELVRNVIPKPLASETLRFASEKLTSGTAEAALKVMTIQRMALVRACDVEDPDHGCRLAVESGNNVKYLEPTPVVFMSPTSELMIDFAGATIERLY